MNHSTVQTKGLNGSQVLWLDNTSELSFTTLTSSTESSNTTSTVPGPGAISGKAILALGKATLRGAEYLIIRRRLQVIASKLPCEDTSYVSGIEEIYDDVLELSRRDFYADTIRTKAISIILSQIGSCHTQRLVKCLAKWPSVELQAFLASLTAILDPFLLIPTRLSDPVRAYQGTVADKESHSLIAFVAFLVELAQANNVDRGAILEGGTLDFLLHMYASNFYDPLAENEHGDIYRKLTLVAACNDLLGLVSASEQESSVTRVHPLYLLWPSQPGSPFTSLHSRLAQRVGAWKIVTPEVLMWRIRSTLDMMLVLKAPTNEEFLLELAADILELSGIEHSEVSIRALRALSAFLFYGKISGKDAIRQYLASSYHGYSIEAMSQIIKNLSRLVTCVTLEWGVFRLPWNDSDAYPSLANEPRLFEEQQCLYILNALIGAAALDHRCFEIMIEANIVGLLRPYLELELRSTSQMARHGQGDIMLYDPSDFKLLESIRDNGPRSLLPPPPESPTHLEFSQRTVVRRGFDIFLHRRYQENSEDTLPRLWRINQGYTSEKNEHI